MSEAQKQPEVEANKKVEAKKELDIKQTLKTAVEKGIITEDKAKEAIQEIQSGTKTKLNELMKDVIKGMLKDGLKVTGENKSIILKSLKDTGYTIDEKAFNELNKGEGFVLMQQEGKPKLTVYDNGISGGRLGYIGLTPGTVGNNIDNGKFNENSSFIDRQFSFNDTEIGIKNEELKKPEEPVKTEVNLESRGEILNKILNNKDIKSGIKQNELKDALDKDNIYLTDLINGIKSQYKNGEFTKTESGNIICKISESSSNILILDKENILKIEKSVPNLLNELNGSKKNNPKQETVASPEAQVNNKKMTVKRDRVNFREEIGDNLHETGTRLKKGSQVEIVNGADKIIMQDGKKEIEMTKVKYNGKDGYIASRYLRETKSTETKE